LLFSKELHLTAGFGVEAGSCIYKFSLYGVFIQGARFFAEISLQQISLQILVHLILIGYL
jgi:hypothetical protein